MLDTRSHTGSSDNPSVLLNSWLCRYGYLETRVHTWPVHVLLSPLLIWSGNQDTPVETPGYTQCLQRLRDVSGNQDTHTHLDFLLGSTVVSTAWCCFLGTRDTHTTSLLDTAVFSSSSDVFPETNIHNPLLLLFVFPWLENTPL